MTASVAPVEPVKISVAKSGMKMLPGDFMLGSSARNPWRGTVKQGVPLEAVLDPAYWAHVAAKLRIGDLVELVGEDGSYFLLLLVRDSGRLYAKMGVVLHTVFKDAVQAGAVMEIEGYEIKFVNNIYKHRVIRKSDNKLMKDKLPSAEDARRWVLDYLKALAA